VSATAAPLRSGSQAAVFEEEALGRAYDLRLLSRLWPFIAPYRRYVALNLLLFLPLSLAELAPAWIVKHGIDAVFVSAAGAGEPGWLSALLRGPAPFSPLAWLGLLYLAVVLAGAWLQYVDSWVMGKTGQAAMRDLRGRVFDHIQSLHMGFFDHYPVGRLVTRATNDIENVAEMFSAGFVALARDLAKMLLLAGMLFALDAHLALTAFAVVPVLAVAAMLFRLKVREAFRMVRVRIARINAYVQENITGMKVVQLFGRERRNHGDFDAMNASHRDAWFMSIRYDAALFTSVELAQYLTLAAVIWQAHGVAVAGTLYVFFDWMRRFFLPLRDLSQKYSVMQSSMASCERIFQLLDTEPAIRDPARPAVPKPRARPVGAEPAPGGEVVFDDVWFAYQPGEWVLRGISFRVAPGEKIALVGPTGAGKTSVISLLARLYEPARGSIRIDGVDLREWRQAELRRRLAVVLQDVFLFSGSVADNIALGRSDLDRAAIERAAVAVHADRFIRALPEGYDTPVRERGSNFSGGERQLLSFARALAHGADILVLDEATSSIDSATEALVQDGIRVLMRHVTAIAIAHRLSTIEDVDRIYVLERGRIVESGPHAELLAAGGLYQRLHRLQLAVEREGVAAAGS